MTDKQFKKDMLTGLSERAELEHLLQERIQAAEKNHTMLSVVLFSLHRIKTLNSKSGHEKGDLLIRLIAKRLENLPIESVILSRFYGTNFVLVLEGVDSKSAIEKTVNNILHVISQPLTLVEEQHIPNITAGVSLYPDNGVDAHVLIDKAFRASFIAYQPGYSKQLVFSEENGRRSKVSMILESDLLDALKNNELKLLYQPQIMAKDNSIEGAEALIRWFNPRLGEVSPVFFIPIAENSGLINLIGEWVIDKACERLSQWRKSGGVGDDFFLSINVSPIQLQNEKLYDFIINTLRKYQLPASSIQVELTETALMQNVKLGIHQLEMLKRSGVIISVDDFGTGYSSLTQLSTLPISIVKLDQSFVASIHEPATQMIVKSIIDLAHQLDFVVVAEGVENKSQIVALNKFGCDRLQGFYFSTPLDEGKFLERFKLWKK